MSENYPKSKLKRKKSSVEELHTETSSKGTAKKNRLSSLCSDITMETDRSVVPAAAWWNREQLAAAESLWVLTLTSALPYLENQHRDLVPDLPQPSTVKPTALKLDEQRWCDLSEEVAPFPEAAPPSPRTSSSDPVSASRQDPSVQSKPAAEPPDRQQPPHSRQHHSGTTTTLQCLTKKPWTSPRSGGEAAPSASVGTEEEQENPQTGSVSRQLLRDKMKACDSLVSLQRRDENKEEMVEDKAVEEEQASCREDGGGGLQSCPMCLLVFPVGFTQMDCDGHLAQCLSEMNVDMTW